MSTSSQLYVLTDTENALSQAVDRWVNALVCPQGNGPDGLLARVGIAWSVVAQIRPQTPRLIRLLALEVVCVPFLCVSGLLTSLLIESSVQTRWPLAERLRSFGRLDEGAVRLPYARPWFHRQLIYQRLLARVPQQESDTQNSGFIRRNGCPWALGMVG